MLGLKKFTQRTRKCGINFRIAQSKSILRKKQRVFTKWLRKYLRVKKQRNIAYKALNHWGQQTMHKVLSSIRHYVIAKKHERLVNLDKILEVPSAVYYLTMLTTNKFMHK